MKCFRCKEEKPEVSESQLLCDECIKDLQEDCVGFILTDGQVKEFPLSEQEGMEQVNHHDEKQN